MSEKSAKGQEDLEKLKDAKIPTRRAKMLMVNPADFMFLFTKGLKVRKGFKLAEGIPDDATLLTIAAEPVRGGIMMVVQSEEYDEIPINQMPPVELISIQTGHLREGHYTKKKNKSRKK